MSQPCRNVVGVVMPTDEPLFLRAEQNLDQYTAVYRSTRDRLTRNAVRELARKSSAERVEHLVDAAIDCVRSAPTQSFPIITVLDATGFDAPFVYRYFTSRDHLEWLARLIEFEATLTADTTMIIEKLTSCSTTADVLAAIDVWLREADQPTSRANRMNRFASLAAVLRYDDALDRYATMAARLLALGTSGTRVLHSRHMLCPIVDPASMNEFMFIAPMTRVIVDLYPDLISHDTWVPVIHRAYAIHLDSECTGRYANPDSTVDIPADDTRIAQALDDWLANRALTPDAAAIISATVPITRASFTGDFTVHQVADAAGVTTSHLYRHFDSKESIQRTALVANFGATTSTLLSEFEQLLNAASADEALDHVRSWVHGLTSPNDATGRRLGMQTLGHLVTGDDPSSDALTRDTIVEILDRFAATITVGQDRGWFTTDVDAYALGAFVFGVLTAQAFFDPCPTAAPAEPWTRHMEHLLTSMLIAD